MQHRKWILRKDDQTVAAPEAMEQLSSSLEAFEYAMLTSACEDGRLRSRPMTVLEFDELGRLWFVSPLGSDTLEDVEERPEVNVSLQNASTYASLMGKATWYRSPLPVDAVWRARLERWHDKGIRGDGSDVALIMIRVEEASIWQRTMLDRLKDVLATARTIAKPTTTPTLEAN